MTEERDKSKDSFSLEFSVGYNSNDFEQVGMVYGLTDHIKVYLKEISKKSGLGNKIGEHAISHPIQLNAEGKHLRTTDEGYKGVKPVYLNIDN